MASHDARRINPGVQTKFLYVGAQGKLVPPTSVVPNFGLKNSQILSGGANPSLVYAINPNASGSLIMLDPA